MNGNVNVFFEHRKANVCSKSILTPLLAISLLATSPIGIHPIESNTARTHYIHYSNNSGIVGNEIIVDVLQQQNLNKIDLMAEFEDDWNGNGGRAFSEEAIDFFRTVIKNVSMQPEIAPTGRNSLYMEYKKADESILAFEVSAKMVEKVFVPLGDFDSAITEKFYSNMIEEIVDSVVAFYG